MLIKKTVLLSCVLFAVLLSCNIAIAQPISRLALFLDVGNIHPKDSLPLAVATLRTRYVRLNKALFFDEYGNVKSLPDTEILFNLFPNVNLVGHITDVLIKVSELAENNKRIAEWNGNMKGFAEWNGNIKGIAHSSFAILLHNPYLPFQVSTPVYGYYIQEIGHDNLYRITEFDQRVVNQMG